LLAGPLAAQRRLETGNPAPCGSGLADSNAPIALVRPTAPAPARPSNQNQAIIIYSEPFGPSVDLSGCRLQKRSISPAVPVPRAFYLPQLHPPSSHFTMTLSPVQCSQQKPPRHGHTPNRSALPPYASGKKRVRPLIEPVSQIRTNRVLPAGFQAVRCQQAGA